MKITIPPDLRRYTISGSHSCKKESVQKINSKIFFQTSFRNPFA